MLNDYDLNIFHFNFCYCDFISTPFFLILIIQLDTKAIVIFFNISDVRYYIVYI